VDLFFEGSQRNIMIYSAILGILGVLAVFSGLILHKNESQIIRAHFAKQEESG